MLSFRQSDRDSIVKDAISSEGKSPEERIAMFAGLLSTAEAITASLSPEERIRRVRIARRVDPLLDPWWRNFRTTAIAEYQCQNSST